MQRRHINPQKLRHIHPTPLQRRRRPTQLQRPRIQRMIPIPTNRLRSHTQRIPKLPNPHQRRIRSHRTANIDAAHANTMPKPKDTGPAHRTHALGSFAAFVYPITSSRRTQAARARISISTIGAIIDAQIGSPLANSKACGPASSGISSYTFEIVRRFRSNTASRWCALRRSRTTKPTPTNWNTPATLYSQNRPAFDRTRSHISTTAPFLVDKSERHSQVTSRKDETRPDSSRPGVAS